MKKLTLTLATFLISFNTFTGVSLAVSATPTKTTLKSQVAANVKTTLKQRADLEIDRRLTALNALIARLNSLKHLSAADKSSYITQIQAEIDSLTALKTKIAGETDNTTLKTDVQSIVTSYRVFALFIPKIHLLAAADTMTDIATNLTEVMNKLSVQIEAAKNSGRDITALQTALTDMNTKLADAKTQYQKAEAELAPLMPDGFPGNKTVLMSARNEIKVGTQDLKAARADAKTIIDGLKLGSTKSSGVTATPSASVKP